MFKSFLYLAVLSLINISYGYHIQPRIMIGRKAATEKYPFFVQVLLATNASDSRQFGRCGGALLNDR